MRSLTLIGAGRVGQVFGRLFHLHNAFSIQQILNKTPASAVAAQQFIGAGIVVEHLEALTAADVFLIAVPDDQLEKIANQLAECHIITPNTIVFHASGCMPATVLDPLKKQGALTASVHPVKSFVDLHYIVEHFAGTFCSLEGDETACEILQNILQDLGAQCIAIDGKNKLLYHAAVVTASNYLVALCDASCQLMGGAGLSQQQALNLIKPLIDNTLKQIFQFGPSGALTGPIARGDIALTTKQYQSVQAFDATLGDIYQDLGKVAVDLARQQAKVSESRLNEFDALFL